MGCHAHAFTALLPALIAILACAPLTAQEPPRGKLERILHGLEHGIVALREVGGQERLVAQLEEVIAHVRRERERRPAGHRGGERDVAERHLRIKRWALEAIEGTDNERAKELMRQAVRATRVDAEGRGDEEAARIRRAAPDAGAQTELLLWASRLHDEKGHGEIAHACRELAEAYRARHGERRARRDEHPEVRTARRHLEIKRWALDAFREAGKEDLADLARHMVQAAAVRLEGDRGAEARAVIDRGPDRARQAEILHAAARLYREWGHEERAGACAELSQTYARKVRRSREGDPRPPSDRNVTEELHELRDRLARLEHAVERIARALERRDR